MEFFSIDKLELWAEVYAVPFVIDLVFAALIFVVGRWVARGLARVLDRAMGRSKLEPSLQKFVADIAYAFMLAIVVIAALEQLGVKTTAAIAIIGAAGLAIGLALQGSLGNFASGVMILTFKPYRVGDFVNVAGQSGTVEAIKMFNTVLVTPDNRVIMVPNGKVTSDTIENVNQRGTRRIDLVFGISYDDDLGKARTMIEEVLAAEPRLLPEPAPTVAVSELADSSVNFIVRPWVTTSDYWAVRFALIEALKRTADERGITIPYPQRDVHLHQVPDKAA
jgi:small conductance mechanosensitive channel